MQEENYIKYEDPKNDNKPMHTLTSTENKKEYLALKLINKKIEEYDELIKDEKIMLIKKIFQKLRTLTLE